MRKMHQRLFLNLLVTFLISACAMVADQYVYKPLEPNEVPATIQFEDKPEKELSVHIRRVNNFYLFNYGGTVSKAIQNNQIQLSPGPVKLTLWVYTGSADSTFPIALDVKSGEHYQLHITPGHVWINDTAGTTMGEVKYTIETVYR